jgi:hypothetical protein
MVNGISTQQIKQELGEYARKHHQDVTNMFYITPSLDAHLRTITKVKGEYPSIHSVTSNVIQRFRAKWDPFGETGFQAKILKSYRIKVNYQFTPADILGSWLAESMYDENARKEAMPISRFIMEKELKPKIQEDLAWLMLNGSDDANPYGQFKYAFPGLCASIDQAMNNGTNPAYLIPLDAISEANATAMLQQFERAIPVKARTKISKVFVSTNVADMYKIDMQQTYGGFNNFTEDKFMKTPLGKLQIIELPWLPDNYVFTTLDGNILKLVDYFNAPTVNDIQILDYDVKVFAEAEIGIDFAHNQLVFVANFNGAESGFAAMGSGAEDLRKLYFVE